MSERMDTKHNHPRDSENVQSNEARQPYEAPRVEKRRSLQQVTLTSGMGQSAVSPAGFISETN